jgi:hypothetical protein
MNKKQLTGLLILSTVSSSYGAVSVTSANVRGFQDAGGSALGAGVLAMLVVDTGGDGFGSVKAGQFQIGSTLGNDDFIDDDNDLIITILDSTEFSSSGLIQGGGGNSIDFAHAGKEFAIYWYPTLSDAGGDTGSTVGNSYGLARSGDWVLPLGDGENVSGTAVAAAGSANFTVQAVPEPTSLALLGLGAFGFIMRRSRG